MYNLAAVNKVSFPESHKYIFLNHKMLSPFHQKKIRLTFTATIKLKL